MPRGLLLFVLLAFPAGAQAEILARTIEYKHDTTTLEGVLVLDTAKTGKRPGILIAHELGANSTAARIRAGQFAQQGYLCLIADLYGKGITPKDAKDAAAKVGFGDKDRHLIRGRMNAALELLAKQTQADKLFAAVGYGVGGSALLELARSGTDLEGIVCIHGDLSTPDLKDAKKIVASILVITGGDDPFIPPAQVTTFESEMNGGGVDWQVLKLGGVAHDFTNPQAGRNIKSGSAYDADADKRAAESVRTFFQECFPHKTQAKPPAMVEPSVPKGVPEKALKILKHVDERGEAMDDYEGGRTFGNFEKRLAQNDDKGRRIRYREWDVNPLRQGVNRGPERLVTGSNGTAWFTSDHYQTFIKVRGPHAEGKP